MKQTDVLLESYFSEGNKIGPSIMRNKYFIGNETMEEFIDRVSNGDENIKELIKDKAFLPGGRILAHIGDKSGRKTTLSNCYVLPAPKDDIDSIFETCANLGNTYKMGGGCGIDLSYLRPKGAVVNNAANTSTGAVSFMNVFETATKVIGQNGRRGALMMMIDGDHPDVVDFINIKSLSDTAITSANVSVRVSDKFIEKAKEGRCYEAYFNYTSGGKEKKYPHVVAPHEILDQISERAWKSAEPGILFWDRIQNYNLMQNQLDFKIAGTNPCKTADAKVLMSDGTTKDIKDVIVGDEVVSYNHMTSQYEIKRVTFSDRTRMNAEIIEFKTASGIIDRGTPDHKTWDIIANDYSVPYVGMVVMSHNSSQRLAENTRLKEFGKQWDFIYKNDRHLEMPDDFDYDRARKEMYGGNTEVAKRYVRRTYHFRKLYESSRDVIDEIRELYSSGLGRKSLANTLGLTPMNIQRIMDENGIDLRKDYVTDKLVETRKVNFSRHNDRNNKLNSVLRVMKDTGLYDGKLIQGSYGYSNIVILPNGRIITSESSAELRFIMNNMDSIVESHPSLDGRKFDFLMKSGEMIEIKDDYMIDTDEDFESKLPENVNLIKLSEGYRIDEDLVDLRFNKVRSYNIDIIESIDKKDNEDVYDITVEDNHNFICNGVLTHNCGELPLPEGGACLLGSLNLGSYVHDGHFDYIKFSKDVQDCVVYLNGVLDEGIEKHPLDIQVESAKRWRAIGLGFMGLHDAMIKLGITYGDENSILFAEKISATMLFNALRKSCDMAKEFGSFTGCNNEGIVQSDIFTNLVDYFEGFGVTLQDEITKLHKDIFNFGIRNAQLLTVAPTGTIGTMLNISTGIEPHFALEYKRKVESFGDDMFFNIKVDVAEEYMKKHNLKELSELPEWFITSSDINPINRMAVQGAAQRFIDNAISSTINLPEETTVEQVRDIYWKAHDLGLKGVTIFRDNCFRSAILTKKDAEVESIESQEELSRGELKQVDKLNLTYIARVLVNGCGKLNLHMGFDEEGNLYDVFAIRSGSGGCSSNIQALVIALSHIIRLGGDLKDFARSIAGTQSCASYAVAKARGVEVSPGHSCGSAIAKLIIKTIKEVEQEVFESKVIKSKSRTLSEVEFGIKEKEKVQFDNSDLDQWTCPSCGARLQKQGGCKTCEECGYSKCD